MLTDAEARDLLHAAADTIEVEPAGPIAAAPRRPLWPIVAAAAAVLLVVGLTTFVLRPSGDPTPAQPAPADDRLFRLGPDQVPSVFGYSTEDAVEMLEDRGFETRVSSDGLAASVAIECDEAPGRAVGTTPLIGTIVEPGATIAVQTSSVDGGSAFCGAQPGREEAWAFVDFANGRGPAPEFAEAVHVYADNTPRAILSGDELTEPDAWQSCSGATCLSPLETIREATEQVEHVRSDSTPWTYVTGSLGTLVSRSATCGGNRPTELRHREGLQLVFQPNYPDWMDGPLLNCQQVTLFHDGQGRIDAVHVFDSFPVDTPHGPPDVIGNTVSDARDRLDALGYTVQEVPRVDCSPVGLVVAQAPYTWDGPYDSGPVALAVVDEVGACSTDEVELNPSPGRPADAFVAWARGFGEPPLFADKVRFLFNDGPIRSLTARTAAQPAQWRACFSGVPWGCPSPVFELRSYDGPVVQSTTPATSCVDPRRAFNDKVAADLAGDRLVRLDQPEAGDCRDAFAIEIWINDDEGISAVNLLLSSERLL